VDAGKQLIDAQWFGEDYSRGRLKELRFDGAAAISGSVVIERTLEGEGGLPVTRPRRPRTSRPAP
jgi:hypothetical protein